MSDFETLDPSCVCRDDRCDRLDLHHEHEITHIKKRKRVAPSRNPLPAWERPAAGALDHSIAKAVSLTYPRHFSAILQFVENDYGSCCMRMVQRRLRILVQRGHLLRIDLGRRLYAYLRPGSKLVNEIDLMREQCEAALPSTASSV